MRRKNATSTFIEVSRHKLDFDMQLISAHFLRSPSYNAKVGRQHLMPAFSS